MLIFNILILEIKENTAPKGHKYLQKNLSIKIFPISIKIKNIKPIVIVDITVEKLVICAKASQGLVPFRMSFLPVSIKIRIKANIPYFIYLSIESSFSLILKSVF
ncbi:hypothetical protein [Clostridium pasteurianum]|uniref:hypothetical protein n=1 Tax=Clostridium pasteurianum TaxID=1501 RepID=UPI001FA88064|nr:hypothetical protein [Clostridium pasteurianum]